MKTVRFSQVVEKCGAPEAYLVLTKPEKDRTLQKAVRAHRVMTVRQQTVGSKTDRGEVGFHPGPNRQFLVFPKSLRPFEERAVVGIKYELLSSPTVPKSQRADPPRPPKKPTPKSKSSPKSKPEPPRKAPAVRNEAPSKKVVPFRPPPDEEDTPEDDVREDGHELVAIKKKIRQAMKILEQGKAVAAYHLLQRIVSE